MAKIVTCIYCGEEFEIGFCEDTTNFSDDFSAGDDGFGGDDCFGDDCFDDYFECDYSDESEAVCFECLWNSLEMGNDYE